MRIIDFQDAAVSASETFAAKETRYGGGKEP